jgi:hypothetical protein
MASASVDNGSSDPDGDPITLSQFPPGPYPVGTNVVTLTAMDSHGASNTCSALVIVRDIAPPVITGPSNITIEFSGESGAAAIFSATATDLCDPHPVVACLPPSESVFPIGPTSVQCIARDAEGNSATCSFTVTVLGARGAAEIVLGDLIALRATTNPEDSRKLDETIEHLTKSLAAELWADQTHLARKHGEKVFHEEKEAVKKLCGLIKDKKSSIPDALLQGFVERIIRAARLLASVVIQDVTKAGAAQKKIAEAEAELAKGDSEVANGGCDEGIEHYRNAWSSSARAVVSPSIHFAKGHAQVEILGDSGQAYIIQASTNLIQWVTIATRTANADGVITFDDADTGKQPQRYYRVLAP